MSDFKYFVCVEKYNIIVEIKKDVKEKMDLLDVISSKLFFPDYFGRNWDALFDCLTDLSWLCDKKILLKHNDVPLKGDIESLKGFVAQFPASSVAA